MSMIRALRGSHPHGLFSLRFFLWGQSPTIRLHRRALFMARRRVPLPLWIILQIWLATRWHLGFSKREIDSAVARFGPGVVTACGISMIDQRAILQRLSRAYCIHPIDAYWLGLHAAPQTALEYVFTEETKAFHNLQNRSALPSDLEDLHDKDAFNARMAAADLPVVDAGQLFEKGTAFDPNILERSGATKLFCKSRSGYLGAGAFAFWRIEGDIRGETLRGQPLRSTPEVAQAWQDLGRADDLMVQPFLKTHTALQPLSNSPQAVSMRVVTKEGGPQSRVIAAFLRVPSVLDQADAGMAAIEVPLAVDPATGEITAPAASFLGLQLQRNGIEADLIAQLQGRTTLPHWDRIVAQSIAAQQEFGSVWAVGWDWIITDDGPVLLEGNVYWDMHRPQEFFGGMLKLGIA